MRLFSLFFKSNVEGCVLHKVVVIFYPYENLVGECVYVLCTLKVGLGGTAVRHYETQGAKTRSEFTQTDGCYP